MPVAHAGHQTRLAQYASLLRAATFQQPSIVPAHAPEHEADAERDAGGGERPVVHEIEHGVAGLAGTLAHHLAGVGQRVLRAQ